MIPQRFVIALSDNPQAAHFLALGKELALRGHRVAFAMPDKIALRAPTEPLNELCGERDISRSNPWHGLACLIADFPAGGIMIAKAWLKGVPTRVLWRQQACQEEPGKAQPKWKSAPLRFWERFVLSRATHVATDSTASARSLKADFGVEDIKCVVFHHSLADPVREFRLKAESPVAGRILCAGRFDTSSGQDILLRALALARRKLPSAHIEFIGTGAGQKRIEQLACSLGLRDKCQFSGHLGPSELFRKLNAATVTVVPGVDEESDMTSIKSLAAGVPVIAATTGINPEIVRDGLDGFLVPPDHPETLAARLKLLLSDPHLRREMRANARHRFLAEFEHRRCVVRQSDWLEQIAGQKDINPARC